MRYFKNKKNVNLNLFQVLIQLKTFTKTTQQKFVIPAKAGIYRIYNHRLDSCLRRNDNLILNK